MASAISAIVGDALRSPNLQVENPMQAYQQFQEGQLRRQQAAESQQEQQANALKLQEAQQQQQSQQAISQAYLKANGVIKDAIPLAVQAGARPSDVMALQDADTKQRKALTDLDTDQLGNHEKHTQAALQTLGPLAQMPEDQAAQAYPQAMAALMKSRDVDPSDLAKAGLDPNTYPGQPALQHWVAGLNGYQQGITNEQKDRETKAAEMRAAAEQASSAATVAEKSADTEQKKRALNAAA